MNEADLDRLLKVRTEESRWTQLFSFEDADGKWIDLSCAIGTNPVTPADATNQPNRYPRKSVYRFPEIYQGEESWESLRQVICSQKACPGCSLILNKTRVPSGHRLCTWQLHCSCYRIQQPNDDQFEDGKMAMSNIKHETNLRKKSSGTKSAGINAMHSKSAKKKLQPPAVISGNESVKRRSNSKRAECVDTRCHMKIVVFCSSVDSCFYLSSDSNLEHTNHYFLEPEASTKNAKDLNDFQTRFLQMLYEENVSYTAMASIMTRLMGEETGQFLPKTVFNMNKKTKQTYELAEGISPDMTDAQKTLQKLRR